MYAGRYWPLVSRLFRISVLVRYRKPVICRSRFVEHGILNVDSAAQQAGHGATGKCLGALVLDIEHAADLTEARFETTGAEL